MVADIPAGYDPGEFPPFAVTTDVALFTVRDGAFEVLLIERGDEPHRGAPALPGGFVRPDENLEEAAARQLVEKAGLARGAWHLEQDAAYGDPARDPRMRVVTVAYWAVCADLPTVRVGGNAAAARLEPVVRVESGAVPLAFDHNRIVRDAADRIRSRMEHTALAAWFCPPEFTIRELRRVYEAVWGAPPDPGNFQRFVRASGAFEQRAAPPSPAAPHMRPERGRPASLWAARRTGDGLPAPAARTLTGPGRSPRAGAATPAGNRR